MSNMPEQLEAILVTVSLSENIMDYTMIVQVYNTYNIAATTKIGTVTDSFYNSGLTTLTHHWSRS